VVIRAIEAVAIPVENPKGGNERETSTAANGENGE
jgi:hypothetical protein